MRPQAAIAASLVIVALPFVAFSHHQDGVKEDNATYVARIEKWRTETDADLRSQSGWLSVAGLFWLNEGENIVGPSGKIQLPNSDAGDLGDFNLHAGVVTFHRKAPSGVKINGKSATDQVLKSDATGTPDRVQVGDLTLTVIERGDRIGIRMRNPNRKERTEFTGMLWYKVDQTYQVDAEYKAYDKPKKMPITNVLGDIRMADNPGYVLFQVNGQLCRLEAEATDDGLFFNFTDKTSGKTTYGAGRFLDAAKPKNGRVILDFNQATCPPCAFTPFATCPLPPTGNNLEVAIEAGEKAPLHQIGRS